MRDEPYIPPQTDRIFRTETIRETVIRPNRVEFRQPLRWKKNKFSPAHVQLRPWDLVHNGSNELVLHRPLIRKSNLDVSAAVTFTNTPFEPVADSWLVIEISTIAATAATAVYLTEAAWSGGTEHPSAYKFDTVTPFAFERARIPIWRFHGSDTGGLVPLLVGANMSLEPASVGGTVIWGQKLIHDGALHVGYILAAVPGQNVVRSVPALF